MRRFISASTAGSSSQTESGGRPPLLSPKLMAPRVGWKRMPISRAARMLSSSLSDDTHGLGSVVLSHVIGIVWRYGM